MIFLRCFKKREEKKKVKYVTWRIRKHYQIFHWSKEFGEREQKQTKQLRNETSIHAANRFVKTEKRQRQINLLKKLTHDQLILIPEFDESELPFFECAIKKSDIEKKCSKNCIQYSRERKL